MFTNSNKSIPSESIYRGTYGGFQWVYKLPHGTPLGDNDLPLVSGLRVYENGTELSKPYSSHQEIASLGTGRYSHWQNYIYFSTTDNSDPRSNGRMYTFQWHEEIQDNLRTKISMLVELNEDKLGVPQVRFTGLNSFLLKDVPNLLDDIRHISESQLNDIERYQLAECLAHAAYPTYKFSEFGRTFLNNHDSFWSDYVRFMDHSNWHSHDRKFTLMELLKLAVSLEGDFAECGVYTGGSAQILCRTATQVGKKVHLFDSFEGLSAPGPNDGDYWSSGGLAVTEETVHQNLNEWACFKIHKGWIPDCFENVKQNKFAFLHLDLDLEEPTKASLEFFIPRMATGGLILLDDYGFESCPGVRKAANEFLQEGVKKL